MVDLKETEYVKMFAGINVVVDFGLVATGVFFNACVQAAVCFPIYEAWRPRKVNL